jgi:hypothetical protein
MRLIILATVAGYVVLMGSAGAVAAEGLENTSKAPVSASNSQDNRPFSFQAHAASFDGNTGTKTGQRAISLSRAEIFLGPRPAGVDVPAPGGPDSSLFEALRVSESTPAPAGSSATPGPIPNGNQAPSSEKPSTVASTVPMTPGEKFGLFATDSFKPPKPYLLSILSGVWDEATDSKHKKPHRTAGDFAADSLTHAARSYAFRVTSNFFEKFAYASAFKQDPRYHRSPYTGFGSRVKYAVTRVLITQGDRNGKNEFNISFLAGGLTTAGISNLWEPTYHQNAAETMSRFGTHVALRALMNVLSEFIGGQ